MSLACKAGVIEPLSLKWEGHAWPKIIFFAEIDYELKILGLREYLLANGLRDE